MMYPKKHILFIILFLFFGTAVSSNAKEKTVKVEISGPNAEVTLLEGSASIIKAGTSETIPIHLGDFLHTGDRITTSRKSRIEIKLPDQSYVRFDELTTFEVKSLAFDKKTKKREINIGLILGKTWAGVSKLFNKKGRFAILTRTAVAGVRGTDFRMDVNKDNSAHIKVYSGEVAVSSVKNIETPAIAGDNKKPEKIPEPHPVDGPHPVSREQWTYIVGSMRQIVIKPDGTATKPFRFSANADMNDWVQWNKIKDARLKQAGKIK
jgi:hypothetical protein